ncbi:MAG: hypothetical protein K5981_08740 [Clostridia bacterium]|nr:hypothetical protein [Clostridia bacterium]
MPTYKDTDRILKELRLTKRMLQKQGLEASANVFQVAIDVVDKAKAAPVKTITNARWYTKPALGLDKRVYCGACDKPNGQVRSRFCPSCGAFMTNSDSSREKQPGRKKS